MGHPSAMRIPDAVNGKEAEFDSRILGSLCLYFILTIRLDKNGHENVRNGAEKGAIRIQGLLSHSEYFTSGCVERRKDLIGKTGE